MVMYMANFKDLSPRSISILEPHIKYWSLGDSINGDLPIDHKFGIETTGFNRYIAEYAMEASQKMIDCTSITAF